VARVGVDEKNREVPLQQDQQETLGIPSLLVVANVVVLLVIVAWLGYRRLRSLRRS